MATQFNYSIANDTLNGIAQPESLTNEIRANANITIGLVTVKVTPDTDNILIEFKANLPTAEETELDAVIAAHEGRRALEDAQKFKVVGDDIDIVTSIVDDNGVKRFAVDLSEVLTGPQGPEGPEGPQGPQGPQGPSGGVFGSEYDYASSEGESTTTSSSWQPKLNLTTANLPSGRYRLSYSAELRNSSDEAAAMGRVTVNGITVAEAGIDYGEDTPNNFTSFSGFYDLGTISGVQDIDMDFREQSGGTARIRRARLEIWRVS